jgi:DNA-directed RNA polymerase II subunit RPB2|uniref:DNA-directed RNA polymerase n=1 Tax=viral metagenome TaxID=1070528 RepID=A0A6C0IUW1_9ZZZZ
MEYKMESAQSGVYSTHFENNQSDMDHMSNMQQAKTPDPLIDYDKINTTNFETDDEIEKRILSHIGNYIEEPFSLIESYFAGKHLECLVRHQTESYNHFINYQIQRTIQMFNPVKIHSENDYVPEKDKYMLDVEVSFENFKLYPPQIHENNGATKTMLPQEAKLRNFTYASSMTIDLNIRYIIRNTDNMENERIVEKKIPKINIGKMPIMLKSSICTLTQNPHIDPRMTGECHMDCGGYFIIKGSEKTVLGQERAAENRIYCFDGKNTTKWSWYAEIKSVPDNKCISPKQIEMMIATKNNGFGNGIYVNIPRVRQPIELFVVFRALGVMSDKDICKYIVLDIENSENTDILRFLQASVIDAKNCMSKEDAILHINSYVAYTPLNMDKEMGARKKHEFTMDVLNNDLFPHCKTLKQKLYLLGYMANKVIRTSQGLLPPDDRDSYANKRIELCGTLLNNLFRNYFNKLVKEMQKHVVREINNGSWKSSEDYENIINSTNIYKIMKSTTIENGINRALSTGDFSIKQSNSSKVGVAQVLNRLTYVSSLSHSRRINTPLEKSGELIAPRKLHNTTWGFLCPAETPEGQSIGVVKNISYMAHITIPTNSSSLYEYIKPYIVSFEDDAFEEIPSIQHAVKVFINGAWIGITDDPLRLYNDMKDKKYRGIINIYTSIIFNYKRLEIRICNDGGRLTRPILKVRDNKALLTKEIVNRLENKELVWNDLITSCVLDESVIEYIDPEEQNFSMIAMKCKDTFTKHTKHEGYFKYTHCEIHPSTIFGVLASCIPFPDHNQAPRNTYQCAMGKQAMGVYATNYDNRMDKTAYVLNYPTRPLVDTRLMNFIHLNNIPSGTQIHVAIMTHTGYNQEDSVLINQASIDRGLFMATIYHTEKDEDKNIIRDEIIRCKPDPSKTRSIKYGNYEKLNNQGFINENERVENRDIIIAKIVPIKENKNDLTKVIKYEDQSKTFRTNEESYVDKNYTNRNGDGYNFAKVRIRALRKPTYGDKFSSRHGQKGTVGNIIPECDMPFTKDGHRPDIIINPHAIPSRMTIGQLKETLLGKVLLEIGMFGDGTSFGNLDVKTIAAELQKLGYESYGNEIMYNGLTGEQLETSIFIGPVFYQRLKHMVADKQHSRSIGPMVNLTRQPAEGRSRDGGFRIGEMERDVMIAHGISKFCRERMFDVSDKYSVFVCKKCGMVASYNDGNANAMYQNADTTIHLCKMCNNHTHFSKVEIPYAYKLMAQELQTINVAPRLITQ